MRGILTIVSILLDSYVNENENVRAAVMTPH